MIVAPPPRNSLEPHTSPPISQYLPFSSPFRIPIDLTLLEFCLFVVFNCHGYGQRGARKLFEKPKIVIRKFLCSFRYLKFKQNSYVCHSAKSKSTKFRDYPANRKNRKFLQKYCTSLSPKTILKIVF
jgi:hypothetical protein